jgi:hypothetical protein
MPTHQQQTQTDIIIGSGGGKATEQSSVFSFEAVYSESAELEYLDLAPNEDRQYSAYELVLKNSSTGSVMATFAARYKAWIDRGTADGPKNIDITYDFDPAASGNSPNWPSSTSTSGERQWKVDAFDVSSDLFAEHKMTLQFRTTVTSTSAFVIQTITDQTDTLLRINLVYQEGSTVILDMVVTITSSASASGGVTVDPPDVTDRFKP